VADGAADRQRLVRRAGGGATAVAPPPAPPPGIALAYASLADVQQLLPTYPIDPTSGVTQAQALALIDQCAAEIDAALGSRGVAVPVTAPPWAVTDLTRLNAQGAAALVYMAAFPQDAGIGSTALGPMLWKTYQGRLSEIRKGIGIPTGLLYAEDDQSPRASLTDQAAWAEDATAVDVFGRDIPGEPAFTRGMTF
jgi:hypothetical protein